MRTETKYENYRPIGMGYIEKHRFYAWVDVVKTHKYLFKKNEVERETILMSRVNNSSLIPWEDAMWSYNNMQDFPHLFVVTKMERKYRNNGGKIID